MAIVTEKFNIESAKQVTVNATKQIGDGVNYNIYQFDDGTYCRPVIVNGTQEMVQCNVNGDTWFTIQKAVADAPMSSDIIDMLNTQYWGGEQYLGYDTTLRDIHKWMYDISDTETEFMSGVFPYYNFTQKPQHTFDEEYQFYWDNFAIEDGSNVRHYSQYESDVSQI